MQLEGNIRARQEQIQRKHDEFMSIQDAIYSKVNKKRAELDSLTRELGQAAASLRDHDALLRERNAQLRVISE